MKDDSRMKSMLSELPEQLVGIIQNDPLAYGWYSRYIKGQIDKTQLLTGLVVSYNRLQVHYRSEYEKLMSKKDPIVMQNIMVN